MSAPTPELRTLLARANGRLWRGRPDAVTRRPALSTGHAGLDAALPDRGWPLGSLIEWLLPRPAHQALRLMLPAACRLNREGRWLALINPPALPYAPGLARAGIDLARLIELPVPANAGSWWALEQLVQHSACGMAIGWLQPGEPAALRRLQLAVEKGGGLAVLCRPHSAAREPSTAALRLRLNADHSIDILKARGALHQRSLRLD